jgi:hypothetical protein
MTDGEGVTVKFTVALQPVVSVYIIGVIPTDAPQALPELLSVAMPVIPVLQVPPAVELLRAEHEPTHTCNTPVIGAGSGFTVIINVL